MVDIIGIEPNYRTYNGNSRKYGITMAGIDYIVKFGKKGA